MRRLNEEYVNVLVEKKKVSEEDKDEEYLEEMNEEYLEVNGEDLEKVNEEDLEEMNEEDLEVNVLIKDMVNDNIEDGLVEKKNEDVLVQKEDRQKNDHFVFFYNVVDNLNDKDNDGLVEEKKNEDVVEDDVLKNENIEKKNEKDNDGLVEEKKNEDVVEDDMLKNENIEDVNDKVEDVNDKDNMVNEKKDDVFVQNLEKKEDMQNVKRVEEDMFVEKIGKNEDNMKKKKVEEDVLMEKIEKKKKKHKQEVEEDVVELDDATHVQFKRKRLRSKVLLSPYTDPSWKIMRVKDPITVDPMEKSDPKLQKELMTELRKKSKCKQVELCTGTIGFKFFDTMLRKTRWLTDVEINVGCALLRKRAITYPKTYMKDFDVSFYEYYWGKKEIHMLTWIIFEDISFPLNLYMKHWGIIHTTLISSNATHENRIIQHAAEMMVDVVAEMMVDVVAEIMLLQ
ncbi:DNA ligase 1-like [Impatiens glandulifera]|uniref:DNA ligase 1-like n=1 Tax=Impatiens glandulifera TaxID=253017 RepID=UPI001FB120DE|nr:DNA ligase 1-like [Impatiens glandulifera]